MKNRTKGFFLTVFLLPTFLLYCVFFLYPNFGSLIVSFFQWKATSLQKKYIGLDNYKELISDPKILQSLFNNVYIGFFSILFCISLALLFSGLVTASRRNKLPEVNLYRSVFFFPNLLSVIVTSILWVLMYSPDFGIINPFLKAVGLDSWTRVWLGEPGTVKAAIVVYLIWSGIGFNFVVFFSAMLNIPVYFYEAAEIDGANEIQKFFKITIPLINNVIKTVLVLGIASTFNSGFGYIKVMTDGGPNYASEILPTYMYRMSFMNTKFGYGAAIGVLIFALTMLLYFITNKLFSRGEDYEF